MSDDAPLFRRENGRTLVRGADGTYKPLLSRDHPSLPGDATEPATASASGDAGDWWIAKRTDPEPGTAPSYDDLTLDEKTEWFGRVEEDDPDDYGERVWRYLGE